MYLHTHLHAEISAVGGEGHNNGSTGPRSFHVKKDPDSHRLRVNVTGTISRFLIPGQHPMVLLD